MTPRRIGVGEPLALSTALGDVALAVGVGREVRAINRHVTSHLGQTLMQGRGRSSSGAELREFG